MLVRRPMQPSIASAVWYSHTHAITAGNSHPAKSSYPAAALQSSPAPHVCCTSAAMSTMVVKPVSVTTLGEHRGSSPAPPVQKG